MCDEPSELALAGDSFADARLDATPTPCGETDTAVQEGTSWVEFVLVDGEGGPVRGERYRVDFAAGPPQLGQLGADGRVRIEGLDPGRCVVCFPDLDRSAWGFGDEAASADSSQQRPRPATEHIVGRAECMASIAALHGFDWRALWEHNEGLQDARHSPFVLAPDDRVRIPERRPGEEEVATEARHTFVRKVLPAKLRLRICSGGEPLAGLPYTLECQGQELRGKTDADGMIEVSVPPDISPGLLRVGEGETLRVYRLAPRALQPASSLHGVQSRLANLGYYHGPVDGQLDASTQGAIRSFQRDHKLEVDGQANEATAKALIAVHRDGPRIQ